MFIQAILSFFILFALSRVVLQVRQTKLSVGGFLFWSGLFIFALAGVLEPNLTTYVARFLGIGRGADAVIYGSIALLFYLIFRLSITFEETRREISELVRKIALENDERRKKNNVRRSRRRM